MNEMMIFGTAEFGQVRATTIDGEPWFVGKDIAEALGYKNSRDALAKHVDDEDKGVAKRDTLGGFARGDHHQRKRTLLPHLFQQAGVSESVQTLGNK